MKINFQSKVFWKLTSTGLLLTTFFTFNQCVVQQYNAPVSKTQSEVVNEHPGDGDPVINSGTPPAGGSGEFVETGATEVARLVADVGLKDFEEIYMSMSVVTGIDVGDESGIRNLFNDLNTQLPTDNSVKNFMTAHQIAIVKLAGEFCHRVFNSSAYYNSFFINFNVGQSPNQVLNNQSGKLQMVNEFINRFWGQNVQPDDVETNARNEMTLLIDDLLVGENLSSSATTRKIAKGVCTAMLASAPVTMF